jgi:hypothetical protein
MTTTPASGSPSSYGEGERVFGPPQGSYDADWVASAARQKDPGLPEETARELAVYAWDHLRAVGELDAPEIARRLFADHQKAGATAANVVATAAVDFCRSYGVALS